MKGCLIMNTFYAILVVYNQSIQDSCTYRFIKEHKSIHLIVCDNSTSDYGNKFVVESDGYTYINMHGNKGISKAYNAALDLLKDKCGYVILLDDDTILNEEYYNSILNLTCDIAVPIVKDEKSILSPCKMVDGVVSRWDGKEKLNQFTAINSGMVVNLDVFKFYRYDEHLFLDYVDHNFMLDMKDKDVQVLDCAVQQEFSGNDVSNLEGSLIRLNIFKEDSKYFYRRNKFKYLIVVLKRKLHLMLQYHSLRFLFV